MPTGHSGFGNYTLHEAYYNLDDIDEAEAQIKYHHQLGDISALHN